MGKIRKSHFWNGSNYIKLILVIIVIFVLSVNLMVNYLYRKYGVQIHIFPENGTWGTNYLKCESENVKNTLLSFFHLFWEYKSNLCCPLLRSFWQRRVQHNIEFWHDEYTFVIDSGHFLFQFANRLFHAPI